MPIVDSILSLPLHYAHKNPTSQPTYRQGVSTALASSMAIQNQQYTYKGFNSPQLKQKSAYLKELKQTLGEVSMPGWY